MIHILYGLIIVLMLIIAGLAFYVGSMFGSKDQGNTPNINTPQAQEINITVIDDARCSDCQTSVIVEQLKVLPFLSQATFTQKDFADEGVVQYLEENDISVLPAVIFNSNALYDGGQITPYLQALPDGQFSLALGAKFNPFITRSENGFLVLEWDTLQNIKAESYIDGNPDAKITWIEYSDMQCPYCAKLHNDETPDTLKEKYGDDLNIIFQHFPLDFHAEALPGAQGLECIGEQNSSVLYTIIKEAYKKYPNQNITQEGLVDIAGENGINTQTLTECIESEKYKDKVLAQMTTGQQVFGVTGTPGNVLINNETGEYEVISGAYPASAFEAVIDKMMQ